MTLRVLMVKNFHWQVGGMSTRFAKKFLQKTDLTNKSSQIH